MSSFGVQTSGFVRKTTTDVIDEIEAFLSANLSGALNFQPTSVLGQIISIMGSQFGEDWQGLSGVYSSAYPDTASGVSLDAVAAITGLLRLSALKSTVTLSVNLDTGTTLSIGRIVEVSQSGNRFVTTAAVTNASGVQATVTVAAESSEFGPVVGLAGTIDTIITPVSGWEAKAALTNASAETYALVDGQTLTVSVDGATAQTATFNTADFGNIALATAAEVAAVIDTDVTGVTASAQGTFVRIESDTAGFGTAIEVTGGTANTELGFSTVAQTAMNQLDASLGRLLETDEDFRVRRDATLAIGGKATPAAIQANLANLSGVVDVFVFENTSLVTDASGLPGKAFEAVVEQGTATDQEVYDAIFDLKPAGIEAHGDKTGSSTDTQGNVHTIKFSNPTVVDIFVEIDVSVNSSVFGGGLTAEGITQIEETLTAFVQALSLGEDVLALPMKCEALDVAGVTDVTDYKVERDAGPPLVDKNIVIAGSETADLQSVNITVNVS